MSSARKRNLAPHPHEAALAENMGAHNQVSDPVPISEDLRRGIPKLIGDHIEEANIKLKLDLAQEEQYS
jgi:hypothetical protein